MPDPKGSNHALAGNLVFWVTGVTMATVAVVMGYALLHQIGNYDRLLTSLAAAPGGAGAVIALARSQDAAVIKTCSILLAFLLVFLGGMYTLQVGRSVYKLSLEGSGGKGALETASPGLVMLTTGALLITVTIWKEYTINFTPVAGGSAGQVAGSETAGGTQTSSAVGAGSLNVDDEDVRAVNSAWLIARRDVASAKPADQARLNELADRLDSLRKILALRKYPTLQSKYAALLKAEQADPSALSALSADDRNAYVSVQKLLGEEFTSR